MSREQPTKGKRKPPQIVDRVAIDSPDDGKSPTDRRMLQLAAHYLGEHAKLLRAFGVKPDGKTWHESAKGIEREHNECVATQRHVIRMASSSRSTAGGMVELEGQDI